MSSLRLTYYVGLLQAFADAYTRDNPGVLPNAEATYLVAFALIMLNTDIHDPRLRSGRNARAPMTKAEFIRNLRSADCGRYLTTSMLGGLFDGIAAHAIEWKAKPSSVNTSSRYASMNTNAATAEAAFRSECELMGRKGLALMKSEAVRQRPFLSTESKHIVKGMFEIMYPGLLVALTSVLDREEPAAATSASDSQVDDEDVDVRIACVDGIKFAAVIALQMDMPEVLEAFTAVLAKITYMQKNDDLQPSQMKRNLVSGQHLQQDWAIV